LSKKFTISTTFTAIDKITGPIDKISSKVGTVGKKISGFSKGIGGKVSSLTGIISSASSAIASFGSNVGDEIAKTARVIGMSTDAFQKFRYIGERSGVSIDEMDLALKKLTVNLGKNADGTIETLARLGISIDDMKSASPDDVLSIIAEGFKNIESPSERASIAVDLFGKSGAKMVNVLEEGKDGISRLGNEATKLGYVLSGSVLDSSEELNDQILNMQTSFKAIGNSMSAKFMPMVSKAVVGLTDFFVENRNVMDGLADTTIKAFEGIMPIIKGLLPTVVNVINYLGGIFSRISTMATPLIASVIGFIDKLLPPILEFIDLLLIAMGPLLDLLGSLVGSLGTVFKSIIKLLSLIIKPLSFVISMIIKFVNLIYPMISNIINPLFGAINKVFEYVSRGVDYLIKSIYGFFSSMSSFLSSVANSIAKPFFDAFQSVGDFVMGIFKGITSSIYSSIEFIIGLIKPIIDTISNAGVFLSKIFGGAKSEPTPTAPISKDSSMLNKIESRSIVDINFSNAPPGVSAKSSSKTPNLSLNLGFVGR